MFMAICLISGGLLSGSKLYEKFRPLISNKANPEQDNAEKKQRTVGRINELEAKYQNFVKNKIDPLFGNARDRQLKTLEELPAISEDEKNDNRRLGVASANLGLAVVSKIFYPPLLIAAVPVLLWVAIDFFKKALYSVCKEHRVNISVLDCICIIWTLVAKFFFVGAVATFLFCIHSKILSKIKGDSVQEVVNVFGGHPRFVWILAGDTEVEIPFERLRAGDIFVVDAGGVIPADGIIKKGVASIDQNALTGESQPAEKGAGDRVFASTLLLSGKIHVLTENAGRETTVAKIGEILNDTIAHKTSIESKTEKIVDKSALPTLALSGLAYLATGTSGGLAILFSSIGYNMRILGPMSTLNFLRIASQNGILVKDGRSLEKMMEVDTVVFDKTGTLTLETPHVSKLHSCNGISETTLLGYAAAAEYRQKHPVAKAILKAADERKVVPADIDNAVYEVGYGIKVDLSGMTVRVGSNRFMEMENIPVPDDIKAIHEKCGLRGYSLVMVSVNEKLAGAIELHPSIRPEAKEVIKKLRQSGLTTYIISGDHEEPTRNLARELGIEHWFAETLPEKKAELVERLQREGATVCFVGDGVNDSIALKKADVSVSLRGASHIAIDSAQIVLMDESLHSLHGIFDIALKLQANQKKNLAISIVPGVICVGGVFLLGFGVYSAMLLYYLGMAAGIGNVLKAERK